MKVRFLLPAKRELVEAVRYYNLQRSHLGDEFRDEIWATIQRIKNFPLAWHPMGGTIRRCQTRRFPFGIIYEPTQADVLIIAVANLHQEPEYWRSRDTQPDS